MEEEFGAWTEAMTGAGAMRETGTGAGAGAMCGRVEGGMWAGAGLGRPPIIWYGARDPIGPPAPPLVLPLLPPELCDRRRGTNCQRKQTTTDVGIK